MHCSTLNTLYTLHKGRYGEQGPERVQLRLCAGRRPHRHRHRLRADTGGHRTRVLPVSVYVLYTVYSMLYTVYSMLYTYSVYKGCRI